MILHSSLVPKYVVLINFGWVFFWSEEVYCGYWLLTIGHYSWALSKNHVFFLSLSISYSCFLTCICKLPPIPLQLCTNPYAMQPIFRFQQCFQHSATLMKPVMMFPFSIPSTDFGNSHSADFTKFDFSPIDSVPFYGAVSLSHTCLWNSSLISQLPIIIHTAFLRLRCIKLCILVVRNTLSVKRCLLHYELHSQHLMVSVTLYPTHHRGCLSIFHTVTAWL